MREEPFNPEIEPRRAFSRLRVGIGARLDTLSGWQHIRLVDLSQGGAQLILSKPEIFREALLKWIRFEAFGIVAWQDEEHLGLQFDTLIPLPYLVETRMRAPSVVREEVLGSQLAAQAWVEGSLNQGVDR